MSRDDPPVGREFYVERVTGIGPVSRPWQGRIITIIRYPPSSAVADFGGQARFHEVRVGGIRLAVARLRRGKTR